MEALYENEKPFNTGKKYLKIQQLFVLMWLSIIYKLWKQDRNDRVEDLDVLYFFWFFLQEKNQQLYNIFMTFYNHQRVIKLHTRAFTKHMKALKKCWLLWYIQHSLWEFYFNTGCIVICQTNTSNNWPTHTGKISQRNILWPTKDIT